MPIISVKALWFQPKIGLRGAIGAILHDGTPVALCSKEKWDLGKNDSLRSGWQGNIRMGIKTFTNTYTEEQLVADGLGSGDLKMTVPEPLINFV